MIDAQHAIALMIAISVAGAIAIDSGRLRRWWHSRRCEMCGRAARRGTVVVR